MIELGHLCVGDLFEFDGNVYKAGKPNGFGWAVCVNVNTHKVKKIHIDSPVEPIKKEEQNEQE